MGSPITGYIVAVAIAGVLNVLLGLFAWFRRDGFSGMRTFVWISALSAIYIFGFACELASDSLAEIRFWVNIEYIGMPFIPPLCLVLVMQYVGLERFLSPARIAMLLAVPALTLLAITTNDFHHLFYKSMYLRPNEPTPMVDIVFGQWYIVHGSYTFGSMLLGIVLLFRFLREAREAYRLQIYVILAGLCIPVAGSLLYLLNLTPNGMDPVPILTCVTSALYLWAMTTSGMFRVVPIARDTVFESMRDGVIVLDERSRIVDFNRAAERLLPPLQAGSIGSKLRAVWMPDAQIGADDLLEDDSPRGSEREVQWQFEGDIRYCHIRISPLYRRNGRPAGRTVVIADVTEQTQLREQLRKLATYDGLTGIYNRAHFLTLGADELVRAASSSRPLAVILFDLDHFKSVNDRYGHDTGDAALRHAAFIASSKLRGSDHLGRYGGEEFAVCLPGASLAEAAQVAERIRASLASSPLDTLFGPLQVTGSFGIASSSEPLAEADSLTIEALLSRADLALYTAKHAGRNTIRSASDAASQKPEPALELQHDRRV